MSIPKFKNEAYTDWSKPANRKKQQDAIAKLESHAGTEYSNIIDGERMKAQEKFNSLNPSNPNQIVGVFQKEIGRAHV